MRDWQALIDASDVGKPCACPGATAAELDGLEDGLQLMLPAELRSLLSQTNGIRRSPCSYRGQRLYWVLDVAGILQYNREVRDENSAYRYMDPDEKTGEQPVEQFLVFSNIPGNGDLYAICLFPVAGIRASEIVLWDHAENERILVAPSLSAWIESWGAFDEGHDLGGGQGLPDWIHRAAGNNGRGVIVDAIVRAKPRADL